ncbi:MAG: VanZ family protein [Aerococcus sp.]|nr:VanZ family protein [Aerococcus sp.]
MRNDQTMLFLGPIEKLLEYLFLNHINHFPLIRLIVFSLDKVLLYFIPFVLLLWGYKKWREAKQQPIHNTRRLVALAVFMFYFLMLIHLTVLRYDWKWWALSLDTTRNFSRIHLVPLVDTFKLEHGDSPFSFWYNFFGNVLWFIPFGFLVPYLRHGKRQFFEIVLAGGAMSILIETCQYFLGTGVTHIDDVIFNVSGVVIGYLFYDIGRWLYHVMRRTG